MGQYITIIYADEKLKIDNRIPHFYENGHVIIPYINEKRSAVEDLKKICKEGMTLEELFDFYIDTEFTLIENEIFVLGEDEGICTDLDNLEEIELVEFLKLLNLPDFVVLSYDDLAGDYFLNFENSIYINSDEAYHKLSIRLDKPYLYKYEGCKTHCLKEMEARRNNFNK